MAGGQVFAYNRWYSSVSAPGSDRRAPSNRAVRAVRRTRRRSAVHVVVPASSTAGSRRGTARRRECEARRFRCRQQIVLRLEPHTILATRNVGGLPTWLAAVRPLWLAATPRRLLSRHGGCWRRGTCRSDAHRRQASLVRRELGHPPMGWVADGAVELAPTVGAGESPAVRSDRHMGLGANRVVQR